MRLGQSFRRDGRGPPPVTSRILSSPTSRAGCDAGYASARPPRLVVSLERGVVRRSEAHLRALPGARSVPALCARARGAWNVGRTDRIRAEDCEEVEQGTRGLARSFDDVAAPSRHQLFKQIPNLVVPLLWVSRRCADVYGESSMCRRIRGWGVLLRRHMRALPPMDHPASNTRTRSVIAEG